MDELSAEEANGTEKADQAEAPESEENPPASEIHEHFYSLFAGVSTIWPQSVCGH